MNNFSVIIPSRNESNLRACIGAIRAAGETCRIVVIDNGLTSRIECLDYLDYTGPFCWPKAVNMGILAAGEDDLIVMGDDALLKTPRGFTAMHEVITVRPHLGMVSAACNGVGNLNQRWPHWAKRGVREELRMLCMICCLIPRSVINTVGMLDQRFNSYSCCDDDLCLRIRQAGYKLGVFDGCFVDHESLPSEFRKPGGAGADMEHGKRMFREKWGMENDEA